MMPTTMKLVLLLMVVLLLHLRVQFPKTPQRHLGSLPLLCGPISQGVQLKKMEDGSYEAKCNYCTHSFKMGNQRSTSSMKHHIEKGCKNIPAAKRHKPNALQKLLQASTTTTAGEANPAVWTFDQNKCKKSFAKMVVAHKYPFSCITHHYLRVFLSDLQPQFKLVLSKNTIRSYCLKIYEEERNKLYRLLNGLDCKLSFTSDLWTNSKGDKGFMALTCHYIDDSWNLRKRTISFCHLPSPHTGKKIADAIYHRLVMWNMDKKVLCFTLDNASNNDACIRELLKTSLANTLPVEGQIFHQRCGCHILNLIVKDGLAVLKDEINKIRETMKYIRHSPARMERYQLAASQVDVPNKKPAWDVATRWNSTYLMLELALQLKPALCRYATHDQSFDLSLDDEEWEAVGVLAENLKVFYDATLKLSGTKYPTLNLYFPEFCEVYLCIQKMSSSPYPFVVEMGKEMFAKWEKYWSSGNTLLAIACVLDPRCKLTIIEYYFKTMYPEDCDRFVENLRSCMNKLYKEYLEAHSNSVQNQAGTSSQNQRKKSSTGVVTLSNTRAGLKEVLQGKKSSEPKKSDIDRYLEDPLDQTSVDVEFDILAWWKLSAPKYPVLARLTRDILAVPISTVASEQTFSTSGRTLSPERNSLNDESMEALICTQDWLRASITENGGAIGDPLWPSDEVESDGSICGN